jgi:NADP-dependent 3-hydroxy acid dehydrogenase YdfG
VTTDQFSLTGKVALVTGGNGGLGKAMAIVLRQAAAKAGQLGFTRALAVERPVSHLSHRLAAAVRLTLPAAR